MEIGDSLRLRDWGRMQDAGYRMQDNETDNYFNNVSDG